ncbi:hypothetical protein [Desulfonatronovibrio magnus]|uniref:hypothetical protein n=1 Tax=Desulfonatronovibrio magnus TaxID=698827 RepID=UPI0005EAF8EA|nr:hypothetical protein [Desulfonatronovibrio magnus]
MRKVFYIFAAHILVLGSLWAWKNNHDQEIIDGESGNVMIFLNQSNSQDHKVILLLCHDLHQPASYVESEFDVFLDYVLSKESAKILWGDPDRSMTCIRLTGDHKNIREDIK